MSNTLDLRRKMVPRAASMRLLSTELPSAASFDSLALLLAEIATGNEKAFARLYELTGGRLLAIARRIVGRSDVAEDVLQDAFLRVWRWAHRYDAAKGIAYAWLVRIVRNRALSAREKLHRREVNQDETAVDALAFDGPDPADRAMRREQARHVNSCLANLPANHRRSLFLIYFEGLTHRELAVRLDVQLGTAKSWVRRGLVRMNKCMAGSGPTS
jgi:RNA polymerase sigma-70 factor, ECF subfamily